MFDEICREQHGVVTRRQASEAGLSPAYVRARLDSGAWRLLGAGVIATFSGPLSRTALLWSAVLRVGRGATLSHSTAAELLGLIDNQSASIHVSLPPERRVARVPGVVVHYSARVAAARHPSRRPPVTRIEETVLDLTDATGAIDPAIALLSAAVGRRLTTVARLGTAMSRRSRLRWRAELTAALSDVAEGCHSLLEVRYLRDVERAHRLVHGRRQAIAGRERRIYQDVRYDDYGVVVELDGVVAHPVERRAQDLHRDNVEGQVGGTVLHYGWDAVRRTPCQVAAEVAMTLRARGWPGTLRRCGPACTS